VLLTRGFLYAIINKGGKNMDNLDSLDQLQAGRPQQPQPDWAEEEVCQRQQKLPMDIPAPWEFDQDVLPSEDGNT